MSTLEKRIVDVIEVIAKEIKRRETGLASKEQKPNLDIQRQFEKIESNHNEVTSSLANKAEKSELEQLKSSVKANAVHTHTVDDIRDINEKFYKMFEDETYAYRFSQLVEMAVGGYVEILEDLQSKYFSMGDVRNAINEAIREERSAREQAFVSDLNVLRQKVESLESARGIVSRQVDRNSRGTDSDDEEMVTLEM